jgi:hypothetical protein
MPRALSTATVLFDMLFPRLCRPLPLGSNGLPDHLHEDVESIVTIHNHVCPRFQSTGSFGAE